MLSHFVSIFCYVNPSWSAPCTLVPTLDVTELFIPKPFSLPPKEKKMAEGRVKVKPMFRLMDVVGLW
jgi:hypothetical protein